MGDALKNYELLSEGEMFPLTQQTMSEDQILWRCTLERISQRIIYGDSERGCWIVGTPQGEVEGEV